MSQQRIFSENDQLSRIEMIATIIAEYGDRPDPTDPELRFPVRRVKGQFFGGEDGTGGPGVEADIRNLSFNGIGFQIDRTVEADERFSLKLDCDTGDTMVFHCAAIRSAEMLDGSTYVGARFVE